MAETTIAWPRKTRELHNHHFASTIWNDFELRDDDIVIATSLVPGAQRHAGSGRTADRPATGRRPPVLPRVAGGRRPPVLAVLGERSELVGDTRAAEPAALAL